MTLKQEILSEKRLNRLRTQGYTNQSDYELSDMAFGIRFAYRLCVGVVITAMLTQSLVLFSGMFVLACLGILLPNHPFDYIYNYTLSKWMDKPQLPARAKQLKFACTIATLWLASVVYFLSVGFTTTAMVLAGMLAFVAALPSTIDYCIPSVIYNALFSKKADPISV